MLLGIKAHAISRLKIKGRGIQTEVTEIRNHRLNREKRQKLINSAFLLFLDSIFFELLYEPLPLMLWDARGAMKS